tara:strand:- start:126 stop:362 length:237 start_codon:yes stop_codon:yes gene_type:complete
MNRRNFNRSLLGLFGVATVPGVSNEMLVDPYVNRFPVEKHKICSPECLEDMKNWGCFDMETQRFILRMRKIEKVYRGF